MLRLRSIHRQGRRGNSRRLPDLPTSLLYNTIGTRSSRASVRAAPGRCPRALGFMALLVQLRHSRCTSLTFAGLSNTGGLDFLLVREFALLLDESLTELFDECAGLGRGVLHEHLTEL
jgi:hypothetical protein